MGLYSELHCHSNFSLLDGAAHPEQLVARAAELGMKALALTDHDAVYGVMQFVEAARTAGVQPILGAELTLDDGSHLTLLVQNKRGWHNLCSLISLGRHHAPKGSAALPVGALEAHSEGLIALSGCRKGALSRALQEGDHSRARHMVEQHRTWFGQENYFIELQHHLQPGDDDLVAALAQTAHTCGVPVVATNNVHYATRRQHRLQDVLVCIRHNVSLEQSAHLRRPNSEYYLKSPAQMGRLFARYPEAIANTARIADRCQFAPQYGLQDLPAFPTPSGSSAPGYLRQLCATSLEQRGLNNAQAQQRLAYELSVIERAGLSNYFLVIWDLVRFARQNDIRCQGRGSAANSLVAYLLGITPVNPLAHNLVFERFLSDERHVTPDIDIDFQADRREEAIQYLYERYGHDHAAMACTFITYRRRSAIRDVGKVLGLSAPALDELARNPDAFEDNRSVPVYRQLQALCEEIHGYPRHLGIHNGGMVLTRACMAERVPIEPATMPDRYVVQWDKEGLESAGLIKVDVLGLRMLSVIAEAVTHTARHGNTVFQIDNLTFDDPVVFQLISEADTIGVFQVESRAQSQMQPIFKPRCFEDLIVAISLIRPGPIQGDMVHPYLRRRLGEEPVTYPHPRLEPVLADTLGVVLFQEQVLQIARELAGFTPGQGELLRRALGSKNAHEAVEFFHAAFIQGAAEQGVASDIAEETFDRLRAFAGYSFPKSHAAAFAVLVYQSAWLKRYYASAFYAALLNHQPMGFWSPAVIVGDARRHGLTILPVDIHRSSGTCEAGENSLRLGLNYVKGFGDASIRRVLEARLAGPFVNLLDFCRRTRLPQRLVENLILVGAFDAWGIPRRKLLWELGKLRYQIDDLDLVYADDEVALPRLTAVEQFAFERSLLNVSIDSHPLAFYREWLDRQGIASSADVCEQPPGASVRLAGLVVVHQAPPSAKGVHFLTLEDEFGLIDVILRPEVYERFRRVLHGADLVVVGGTLQRREAVVNIVASQVRAL